MNCFFNQKKHGFSDFQIARLVMKGDVSENLLTGPGTP